MTLRSDKYYALAAELLRSLSRFLVGIAIARSVGSELYASFVLMITAETILHTVANSMWAMPMASQAPGLPHASGLAMMEYAVRCQTKGSLLGSLPLILLWPWLGAEVSGATYAMFVGAAVGTGALGILRTRLQSLFQARRMLIADFWSLSLPVFGVAWAWAGDGDVLLAYWSARAAGALISLGAMRDEAPESAEFDRARFLEQGKHMLGGSVANSICSRTQPFVLAAVATNLQIGLFGAASSLLGPLRMPVVAMGGVLRPRLALVARSEPRQAWKITGWALAAVALVGGGATLVMGFAGERLALAIYGPSFAGLGLLLPLASIQVTLAALNSLVAILIQTLSTARITTQLRMVSGLLALVLVVPATLSWGAMGAFGSLIAAELAYGVGAALALAFHVRRTGWAVQAPSSAEPAEVQRAA